MTSRPPHVAIVALLHLLGYAPLVGFYLSLALSPDEMHETNRLWWLLMQFMFVEVCANLLALQLGYGMASTRPPVRPVSPRERTWSILLAGVLTVLVFPAVVAWLTHEPARGAAAAFAFLPRILLAWRARGESRRYARALGRSGAAGLVLTVCCVAVSIMAQLPFAATLAGYYLVLPLLNVALFRDSHYAS